MTISSYCVYDECYDSVSARQRTREPATLGIYCRTSGKVASEHAGSEQRCHQKTRRTPLGRRKPNHRHRLSCVALALKPIHMVGIRQGLQKIDSPLASANNSIILGVSHIDFNDNNLTTLEGIQAFQGHYTFKRSKKRHLTLDAQVFVATNKLENNPLKLEQQQFGLYTVERAEVYTKID